MKKIGIIIMLLLLPVMSGSSTKSVERLEISPTERVKMQLDSINEQINDLIFLVKHEKL